MTNIKVRLVDGDFIIEAKGHANFAPMGRDIVCSAISAILQTAVLGLQNIAEQYPDHVTIEEIE
jgi:uncharacterized protein YsxB (DUF464 family)